MSCNIIGNDLTASSLNQIVTPVNANERLNNNVITYKTNYEALAVGAAKDRYFRLTAPANTRLALIATDIIASEINTGNSRGYISLSAYIDKGGVLTGGSNFPVKLDSGLNTRTENDFLDKASGVKDKNTMIQYAHNIIDVNPTANPGYQSFTFNIFNQERFYFIEDGEQADIYLCVIENSLDGSMFFDLNFDILYQAL